MAAFFTSDWHLGSSYVLKNGLRPFKNIETMNDHFIKITNNTLKKGDFLVHVGDFCNRKNDRGYECLYTSSKEYLEKINFTVILIQGNHDLNNNVPVTCKHMTMDICQYKNVTISHYPSYYDETKKIITFKPRSIHLCGHVHSDWKYKYDYDQKILNINVGVDAWKYNLISDIRLSRYIQQIINEHKKK